MTLQRTGRNSPPLISSRSKAAREGYLAKGGSVDYQSGQTLEAIWFLGQMIFHDEYICVASSTAPNFDPGRITRLAVMSPAELVDRAKFFYAGAKDEHLQTLTFHRSGGHVIDLIGYDPSTDTFAYWDPWPGQTLLTEWVENPSDVTASAGMERTWRIKAPAIAPLLYAYCIPVSVWQRIHGYTSQSRGPKILHASEMSNEQRQEVMDFISTCSNAGYLSQQGFEDVTTILNRGLLYDEDREGNTLISNLRSMITTEVSAGRDPGALLNPVLRAIADPPSIQQLASGLCASS
jgi:hypothetical protein